VAVPVRRGVQRAHVPRVLLQLVAHFAGRKVFLVVDNGPCHWLDEAGKAWLAASPDLLEIHRLPPYSPEFNPVEGCWKATRRVATHNRYYRTTDERDRALNGAFTGFQRDPATVAGHVRRFREGSAPTA
jgi:hypothetical protein